MALSAAGLNELSVTVGPAAINAGGVTLRPFVTVAAGLSPANGRRIAVGMALDDTHRFAARWLLDTQQFAFVASDGAIATAIDTTDPAQVALRVVEVVADLVAGGRDGAAGRSEPARHRGRRHQRARPAARRRARRTSHNPSALIGGLFDPSTLLARIHKLFVNLAGAGIAITVEGAARVASRRRTTRSVSRSRSSIGWRW